MFQNFKLTRENMKSFNVVSILWLRCKKNLLYRHKKLLGLQANSQYNYYYNSQYNYLLGI